MKTQIIDTISDLVSDFLYYNRKEDEDLPVGQIQISVRKGDVTIKEMVNVFEGELKKRLNYKG